MQFAAALITAVALLAPGVVLASEGDARVPGPEVFKGKGERCVEDTPFMRRNHMELILHQRDETMHAGIRTKKHSLKNCINCHADPKTNSVLGENGFCQDCHAYASVKMDCFSCHSDKPEPNADVRLGRSGHLGNPHVKRRFKHAGQLSATEKTELIDAAVATGDTQ